MRYTNTTAGDVMSEYIVRVGPKCLTYRYASPLQIGDEVLLPATPYSGGPWKATVTASHPTGR